MLNKKSCVSEAWNIIIITPNSKYRKLMYPEASTSKYHKIPQWLLLIPIERKWITLIRHIISQYPPQYDG